MHGRILITLLLIVAIPAMSQVNEKVILDHYTIPGIIKSTYTASIVQDEHGLLWFGTSSGLFRYDGNRFAHYKYEQDGISLDKRQVNVLLWDTVAHRLLIATRMGGLLQLQQGETTIKVLSQKDATINALAQTSDGRIWALGMGGLYEVVGDTLRQLSDYRSLQNATILHASGNKLFVGGVLHVGLFENGKQQYKIDLTEAKRNFTSTTRVASLMHDNRDQLWIGLESEGILIYDLKSLQKVREILPDKRPFYSRINAIAQDRTGLVWILTKAEGIAVFNPVDDEFQYLRQDAFERGSISGNNCYAIIEDKTGLLWIGTNGDINFYNREQRKFKHYFNDPVNPNSLSDNMVRSVYQANDGKLWVGTDGGFINILDLRTERVERIAIRGSELPAGESITPFCYLQLSGKKTLVGTNIGLLEWSQSTNQFSYYKPLADYLKKKRVRKLLFKDNKLYGLMLGVFFEYDIHTKQFSTHILPSRNNATELKFDSRDSLWVGSNSSVSIFNKKSKEFLFQTITSDTANIMILSIDEVKGKMFISTLNHGIYQAALTNGAIEIQKSFDSTNGLPDNTVYGVLPDDFGNLWIPTNRGLSRIDPVGRFIQYDVSEGVQAEEFNRLTHLKLSDGTMAVAGINGLNIIDPIRAIGRTASASPIILSVLVRTNASEEQELEVLGHESITIPNNANTFRIAIAIPDYRRPMRYETLYRLEGFDAHWMKVPENNIIQYSQVRPGGYVLKIKTINALGEANETSLALYLKPPFYITWWFRLILSVIVIGVAIISFRLRVLREKRDKAKLEELLRERTKEIEQSKQQLANLNDKKDLIFSILSHDLRSPLTTLKGFLGLLVDDGENFTPEEIKKHAELIRASVSNSLDLIDNTLFWSLSQMGSLQCQPISISVNELLLKVKNLYQLALTRKNITLHVNTQPNLYAWVDDNMVYVIVRNLVSNAIKFTPDNKSIFITASRQNDRIMIAIKDEGVGMSWTYVNTLFTEDNPVIKKGTANEKGTGLGLALCQRFVAMNNGTLTVRSSEGEGSEFIVELLSV